MLHANQVSKINNSFGIPLFSELRVISKIFRVIDAMENMGIFSDRTMIYQPNVYASVYDID